MTKTSIKTAAIAAVALLLTACNGKKFQISGNITEAKDSVLYFENVSLDGPVTIDSVKLSADGAFSFSDAAPEAPEFYRLRIAGQVINLSVDSTETITVKAAYPTMATGYSVQGSEECKVIKDLALKQINLQTFVVALMQNPNLGVEATTDSIQRVVERYKQYIKTQYIYRQPMKASSYFALFQAIGNSLIFNPRENKEDIKAFAAVATSWDAYYPGSLRGQNLHNIAIEGMKNVRIVENNRASKQIDASKVSTANLIDIALPDNHGNVRHLTDLAGKVVLLDFHVFGTKESTQRIMLLRELYNKYHAQGLEIYQVSLDSDEHFWKNQTAALPWISVRDADGVDSRNLLLYNVRQLPTFFLIDKTNTVTKRDAQVKDIDAEIKALL